MPNLGPPGVIVGVALASLLAIYFLRKRSRIPSRWRRVGTLGKIYCYPVKSCKGIAASKAQCLKNGVTFAGGRDRAFVIIDKNNDTVSSKHFPSMFLIAPSQEDDKLVLKYPQLPDISVDLTAVVERNVRTAAKMFKHVAPGVDLGDEVSKWLELALLADSSAEKRQNLSPLRLLYMPPDLGREMKHHENTLPSFDSSHMVNYAGVTSYMVMSDASIEELSKHLKSNADERPFRPSLYIHAPVPYEENEWEFLRVNGAIFRSVMTCTRCAIVNIDPDRGVFREEKPLEILKRYRTEQDPTTLKFKNSTAHGPILGQYFQIVTEGEVSPGDEVFAYP